MFPLEAGADMRNHILVGSAFILIFGLLFLRAPDAIFRSSDGQWADSEVGFKGRDFRTVVEYFEAYKLKCGVKEATLLRATSRNWVNIFAWYGYLTDKKWRVPYSGLYPERGDYFEPSCQQGGWSDAEWKAISAAADREIDGL